MIVGYDPQERLQVHILAPSALKHEVQLCLVCVVQLLPEDVRVGADQLPEPVVQGLSAPRAREPLFMRSARPLLEPRRGENRRLDLCGT